MRCVDCGGPAPELSLEALERLDQCNAVLRKTRQRLIMPSEIAFCDTCRRSRRVNASLAAARAAWDAHQTSQNAPGPKKTVSPAMARARKDLDD